MAENMGKVLLFKPNPQRETRSTKELDRVLRQEAQKEGVSIEQYAINRLTRLNPAALERWKKAAKKEGFDSLEQFIKYYLED